MARLSITQVVRHFCLECQGNSSAAVRECCDECCALWPHRVLDSSKMHAAGPAPEGAGLEQSPAGGEARGLKIDLLSRPSLNHAEREAARRVLLRAVRRQCMSCAASRAEVRACAARESCGLWSYRFGVRPETYRAVRQRFLRPKNLSLFTM
ncbi:MAG: hypothetical protein RRY29_09865 [Desulfovibrionaceae bacterium]